MKERRNFYIRERDPGYTYDMTEAEAGSAFPWLAEYWQTFGGFFSRPPGGESLADVAARVRHVPRHLSTTSGLASASWSSPTAGRSAACGSCWSGGSTRRCRSCCENAPINCGVTTYRARTCGDVSNSRITTGCYWTVGAPEDGR